MSIEKTCPICKKHFTTKFKNRVYCSDSCKWKSKRNGFSKKQKEKTCIICKKKFIAKYHSSTCCSRNCQYIASNDKRPRKTAKRYKKHIKTKQTHIDSKVMKIIYGSILGDGFLYPQTDGFHRLSLCHSIKQLSYLKYKMKKMSVIFKQLKPNRYEDNRVKIIDNQIVDKTIQYHAHSISHPDLTSIYKLCYRNKKQYINKKFLRLMTPTSLLIWYLDDGSTSFRGRSAKLCTNAYSISEVKTIKMWIWQKFNIHSKIRLEKCRNDKEYPILLFSVNETQKLFNLFRQCSIFNELPKSMMYKFKIKDYVIN